MRSFSHGIMFHHFHGDTKHMPGQGSITESSLLKIINYLREKYNLLNADVYEEKICHQKLSPSDVVLTFDDGLKSQFDIAFPILESQGIKAFFFLYNTDSSVASSHLEYYRDFRHIFFKEMDDFYENFFRFFEINHPQICAKFMKEDADKYLSDYRFYTRMDRHFRYIRDVLLTPSTYSALMNLMLSSYGYNKELRTNDLFMNKLDIKHLSSRGHLIGLHSATHPTRLDMLPIEEQQKEYADNIEFIETLIGRKPKSMSHPCGRYNSDTVQVLSKFGIKLGFCASIHSHNNNCGGLAMPRENHSTLIKHLNL